MALCPAIFPFLLPAQVFSSNLLDDDPGHALPEIGAEMVALVFSSFAFEPELKFRQPLCCENYAFLQDVFTKFLAPGVPEGRFDPVDEKPDQMDLKLLACENISPSGFSDKLSFFGQGQLFMFGGDFSIGLEHV
ncbi:MAG: hypothetical protein ABSE00_06750 [Chitinispirillaceae bacterium]